MKHLLSIVAMTVALQAPAYAETSQRDITPDQKQQLGVVFGQSYSRFTATASDDSVSAGTPTNRAAVANTAVQKSSIGAAYTSGLKSEVISLSTSTATNVATNVATSLSASSGSLKTCPATNIYMTKYKYISLPSGLVGQQKTEKWGTSWKYTCLYEFVCATDGSWYLVPDNNRKCEADGW